MNHSPARILIQHLRDEEIVSTIASGDAWPGYISSMPDGPEVQDDAVCLYDTAGQKEFRLLSGENTLRHGIQARVRARDYEQGWQKALEIANEFEAVHRTAIEIDSEVYTVDSIEQSGPPNALGKDEGTGRREIFTVNFLVTFL